MPRNSTPMIHTARQQFDRILDSLHAQSAAQATAYQVEQNLFAQLLALGRLLLKIFFALCAERSAQPTVHGADGTPLRLHSWKPRRYVSVFGEMQIERPYFWAKGRGGQMPMDAAVSLPDDAYSDLLREHADLLSAQMAYGETAAVIEHLLGLSLSTSALTRLVERDAGEVVAFYREASQPEPRTDESRADEPRADEPCTDAPVLVVQADGKGVPMRPVPGTEGDRSSVPSPVRLGKGQKRTKKKEAVVTSLYTSARRVRTAEEVLDSFFRPPGASSKGASSKGASPKRAHHEEPRDRPHDGPHDGPRDRPRDGPRDGPQDKKVWATLQGKAVAFARLAEQVQLRDGPSIRDRVALSDGCTALQDQFREHFPRFEVILDFVHVSEYLWSAATALFEETGEARLDWVLARSRELLTGRHDAVLARLRRASEAPDDACARAARYFDRNAERMDYARYLANGWPIATGVIEGACRHLVKDRCETSGMRWHPDGAEQVLGLRSVWTNGDWDAYHRHRREQRHHRLYGPPLDPLDTTETLEEKMWRMAA